METPLHAVINKTGVFDGFSANYAGAGFSDMKFKVHGLDAGGFQRWVQTVKSRGGALDRDGYLRLEKPSEREPVRYFASVPADLYAAALNQCVDRTKMCASEMMRLDARAGRRAAKAAPMAGMDMSGMDMPAAPADHGVSATSNE
jgi:cytochrome o ubiquinol oxidase subunit 2